MIKKNIDESSQIVSDLYQIFIFILEPRKYHFGPNDRKKDIYIFFFHNIIGGEPYIYITKEMS